MNHPVIIIGMEHSGIPLISETLHQAGIFMGEDQNENAESELFGKLNDWIFAQAGATWDSPQNFEFIDEDFSERMTKALRQHLRGRQLRPFLDAARRGYKKVEKFDFDWGWAGSLNTFTIRLWKEIFDDAKIIHVHRNPLDVVESLQKQNEHFKSSLSGGIFKGIKRRSMERKLSRDRIFDLSLRINHTDECVNLWRQYLTRAMNVEEFTGLKTYHVSYENLIKNFMPEAEKLFHFLGFKIPDGSLLEMEKKIKGIKCYTFLKDNELNEYYQSIKNQSLLTELNYHNIR